MFRSRRRSSEIGMFSRLVQSDRLEALLAGFLAALALVLQVGTAQPWQVMALDLVAYTVAAVSPRWPRSTGLVLGLILLSYLALPTAWATMGEYALFIPILGAGMRGLSRARWIMSVGYFLILVALAWKHGPSLSNLLLSAVAWAVLIGIVWLVGNAFLAVTEAERRARAADLVLQRQQLARELHDTVARSLTAVTMAAERARLRGGATDAELAQILDAAASSVDELRLVMKLLREPDGSSATLGTRRTPLGAALSAAEGDLERNGFRTAVSIEGDLERLPSEQAEALGAATGEAVNNIIKHGDPTAPVAILAGITDAGTELVFLNQPQTPQAPAEADSTLGIWGMRQRLAEIGGEVATERTTTNWITRLRVPSAAGTPDRAA